MMNEEQRLRYSALLQKGQAEAQKAAEVRQAEHQQRERDKALFEEFINDVLTPALAEAETELAKFNIRVSPSDPKLGSDMTYWRIFHTHSDTTTNIRSLRITFDGAKLTLLTPSTAVENGGPVPIADRKVLPVGSATIEAITHAVYDLVNPPPMAPNGRALRI